MADPSRSSMNATEQDLLRRIYRKMDMRIVTILLVAYLLDCMDRLNIGFAQKKISEHLGMNSSDYGMAAGIFFIGYVLFEIPSNLMLPRVGARRTFARIMVLWGATSACMGLLHDKNMFYILRFMLGMFEAGFAPACMFYLGLWYPPSRLATVLSVQQTASPLAGVMSGPLSGWLISSMDHVGGVDGWRWMFLLEGLPSIIMGVVVFFVLPDRPEEARWLDDRERAMLEKDNIPAPSAVHFPSFGAVLRSPVIYVLSLAYFCLICGIYTVNFWLPNIIRNAGVQSELQTGLLSAIPYAVCTAAIIIWARRSDRTGERRLHSTLPAALGALALFVTAFVGGNLILSLVVVSIAISLIFSAYIIFWTVPCEILKGPGAVGGLALVNSIGLMGGFCSPIIIGHLTTWTGTLSAGLICMGMIVATGSLLLFLAVPRGAARQGKSITAVAA